MSTTLPYALEEIGTLYAFLETGCPEVVTRSRQSLVSAFALFLYDYVLTISDEIEYIWDKEWSFGKLLFISNRYISFALAIFDIIIINRGDLGDKLKTWELWGENATPSSIKLLIRDRLVT
ncbi:hypothetical protein M422DRAFT_263085 [Sphaerobolus stellatus SS14]|uniref:DUF6533 domain-containing protein n=1 Tax=Sphaerobolus stellatus (strain SS14) TaxID=990650 RepID=A0A0C9TWF5_SPHS4|nr:hypothetical protein M422DRAFT_263085 [Sphaerobolus stellatus SS14]